MKPNITLNLLYINILLIFQSNNAFAGLSMFSRANCINHESISWDTSSWYLSTQAAINNANGMNQYIDEDWSITWRSAAVCWFCASVYTAYSVYGTHSVYPNPNLTDSEQQDQINELLSSGLCIYAPVGLCKTTYATDCNLGEW